MGTMGTQPATKQDLLDLETSIDGKLGALETRIDGKLGGLETRIDGKLDALEARIDAKLDNLEARFEGKLDAVEVRIADRVAAGIQEAETRILRAVYGYTETVTARLEGSTRRLTEFDARLAILEGRVLEVEKRLNLPPAA